MKQMDIGLKEDANIELASCPMKKEKFDHFKKIIEERSFNEHDVRRFLHLFLRNRKYKALAQMNEMLRHRKKDNIFKMMQIQERIENRILVENPWQQDNKIYDRYADELVEFAEENNFSISEQAIKEIMLCLFSLLQYSVVSGCHWCLIQKENEIGIGIFKGNKYLTLFTVAGVHFEKQYPYGLISDPVSFERIDGKLTLVITKEKIVAEVL